MSKKLLIVGVVLFICGAAICGISFATMGFDVGMLNTVNMVTNQYDVSESFSNISISGNSEEIVFAASEDGRCRVVCHEDEKWPHSVSVNQDTLTISSGEEPHFVFGIRINNDPVITVYLPGKEYGALHIDSDTGDVVIPDSFSFDSADISLDTGDADIRSSVAGILAIETDTGKIKLEDIKAADVTIATDTGHVDVNELKCDGKLSVTVSTGESDISDVTCAEFYSEGSTGDLEMSNVIASGGFIIKRSTGDVSFEDCDAETIKVETSTGDVEGILLSDKIFVTTTSTGDVKVPQSASGGKCEITTSTGDIRIDVE